MRAQRAASARQRGVRPSSARARWLTVQAMITLNVVWTIWSIGLLITDYVVPTALGSAFVIAQAAVAAVLAELQFIGLRRQSLVTA